MISMHCFKNRRILIILNLVGCVGDSVCNSKRSESSSLKFLTLRNFWEMIFVKNFLSNFYVMSQFKSISVGMRSSGLISTSPEKGRIDSFEITLSFQECS